MKKISYIVKQNKALKTINTTGLSSFLFGSKLLHILLNNSEIP